MHLVLNESLELSVDRRRSPTLLYRDDNFPKTYRGRNEKRKVRSSFRVKSFEETDGDKKIHFSMRQEYPELFASDIREIWKTKALLS